MADWIRLRRIALPFAAAFFLSIRTVASDAILEDIVRQGYDLSPTATVSVRNTDGRIFIYGSSDDRLEIMALRRALSKERLEAIKIAVSIENDVAVIDTIYPPASKGLLADRSGTVDYVICVPQRCTLAKVELARGEVLIEGISGERIEARLGRGRLHVRNCFSAVRVSVGEGRLDAFFGWWNGGAFSLRAEAEHGELRVALPPGAALQVDAEATRGRVVDRYADSAQRNQGRILKMKIGGDSPVEFHLRTTEGNIELERAY